MSGPARRGELVPAGSGPPARRRTGAVRPAAAGREIALIDLLDRLLQGGVAIQGDITLSAAGIDLVALDLRVVVAAIDKLAGS